MTNEKKSFIKELRKLLGDSLHKLSQSQSLYEVGDGVTRIYIRYSRVHNKTTTFYGLREIDLQKLEGYQSFICFLWDGQQEPLLLPFAEFEDIFHSASPAPDGQYKSMIYFQDEGTELYIARNGRFNVEGYFGWDGINAAINNSKLVPVPEMSHSQVQTLLGGIGSLKGYDIWIPKYDRGKLDWTLTHQFNCRDTFPHGYSSVQNILQEVDVIWIHKGSNKLRALFEVEHSTPIYSGLLRFNDIHLANPQLDPRFSIVANNTRRSLFISQIQRPTFQTSGLDKQCTFLEYVNVFGWHNRLIQVGGSDTQ